MGVNTSALISGDIKLFFKALKKVCDKYGYEYDYSTTDFEGGFFISLAPIRRSMFVIRDTRRLEDYKKELPKSSRRLKNAKTMINVSFGCDYLAQNILTELVTAHDNGGYILLNDCGFGKYLEVDSKGIIIKNLNKKQHPQVLALRKYFNDFPQFYFFTCFASYLFVIWLLSFSYIHVFKPMIEEMFSSIIY